MPGSNFKSFWMWLVLMIALALAMQNTRTGQHPVPSQHTAVPLTR